MIWYVPVDDNGVKYDRYSFLSESAARAHRPESNSIVPLDRAKD